MKATRKSTPDEGDGKMQLNGSRLTIVAQSSCPRFAYTTGLKPELGFDFLIPGMCRFSENDLVEIVDQCAAGEHAGPGQAKVGEFGDFVFRQSDRSWVEMMALAAIEHYGTSTPFIQIAQNQRDSTIDTPDTSRSWNASAEPVWKWLKDPWGFSVPADSSATTNLAALRGAKITEAARWEDGEWELFAGSGSDTPKDELRVLPLATFLATDPSISGVLQLQVGEAVWRHSNETDWHEWKRST